MKGWRSILLSSFVSCLYNQIDHITPDSLFEYNSFEDQRFKDSWALENLQPLRKHDNCSKGNKYKG
jgi:5-methylcytosine-specific restriction endonuclease McrA